MPALSTTPPQAVQRHWGAGKRRQAALQYKPKEAHGVVAGLLELGQDVEQRHLGAAPAALPAQHALSSSALLSAVRSAKELQRVHMAAL